MAEIRMNIGLGKTWIVNKSEIDNSDITLYLSRMPLYLNYHKEILKARRFMKSMGFTKYCPYFDYIHIPRRSRFDRIVVPTYYNSGGKYFGSTPYEKLHRIEIQRRNYVYQGKKKLTTIHSRDYMSFKSNGENFEYEVDSSNTDVGRIEKYEMNRLMRVNIYRYIGR